MLPTFVIGLREGLEAALIVGIVGAFLRTNGRPGDLRRMWLGVLASVLLCIGVGIGLQQFSDGLPQREQEMLECVIAVVAVAMVTFMILWMREHSRSMKSSLEGAASAALEKGSAAALIAMAFLAVLREGFETSVFLVAALQNSASGAAPLTGAVLGIAVSLVLGWLIYRGALRFNMAKFFTVTSVFLVLVAAGLVMKAFRAAYEAGWLAVGQQQVADLTGVIPRGSVREAIIGGVFGLQTQPVLIEALAYLAYALPMLAVILLPKRLAADRAAGQKILLASAATCALVAGAGLVLAQAPSQVADHPEVQVVAVQGDTASLTIDGEPLTAVAGEHLQVAGVDCVRYSAESGLQPADGSQPATITGEQIHQARGRYPIGLTEMDAATAFPATWTQQTSSTVDIDPLSHAVLEYQVVTTQNATVTLPTGSALNVGALSTAQAESNPTQTAEAAAAAKEFAEDRRVHETWARAIPLVLLPLGFVLAAFWLLLSRGEPRAPARTRVRTAEPLDTASV